MRRCVLIAAVIVPAMFFLVDPGRGQNAPAAAPVSPDALLGAYHQAIEAKNWPAAVDAAQKMVEASATAEHLRLLGEAQLNSGATADALITYDRALAASQTEKPAEGQPQDEWKETHGKIWLGKGNALLKSRRSAEAMDAYTRAASLVKNPSVPTFNICATYYNAGDTANAGPACRKAVEVDPANANAWFVLGSVLYGDAKVDASGKIVISSECRQALDKYLELAPQGPHAADVKEMLAAAGK